MTRPACCVSANEAELGNEVNGNFNEQRGLPSSVTHSEIVLPRHSRHSEMQSTSAGDASGGTDIDGPKDILLPLEELDENEIPHGPTQLASDDSVDSITLQEFENWNNSTEFELREPLLNDDVG